MLWPHLCESCKARAGKPWYPNPLQGGYRQLLKNMKENKPTYEEVGRTYAGKMATRMWSCIRQHTGVAG